MKYQVKYSPIALRDLDRVWDEVYNASKDYDTTQQYLEDLLDRIEAKADYPKSAAPLYYDDLFTGYYYVTFKAYIAFYRIDTSKILVDRVLYSASDYMRILHLD